MVCINDCLIRIEGSHQRVLVTSQVIPSSILGRLVKKQYVTRIDSSAEAQENIIVSGGRIGSQLELSPLDLAKAAKAEFADITRHSSD